MAADTLSKINILSYVRSVRACYNVTCARVYLIP